jgi:hypothetical protein
MVNNFTYINKTSNHASSYFTEHKKDQRYMTLEIQALASRKSGGVNPFTIRKKNTNINSFRTMIKSRKKQVVLT